MTLSNLIHEDCFAITRVQPSIGGNYLILKHDNLTVPEHMVAVEFCNAQQIQEIVRSIGDNDE